jgi:23S rRNA (cytosine1962-C5)-methyltransferase
MIESIISPSWSHYELIDSGNGKKLEKFGKHILNRPEPQAIWSPRLSESEWVQMQTGEFNQNASHKGQWLGLPSQEPWKIHVPIEDAKLGFKLKFTSFKHVGIFPEQAANWKYIYNQLKKNNSPDKKVLNLFAYTGGASLAAKAAGADVVHVDSVKQVISWASENQDVSKLKNIRWVVEDALKFTNREVKRGHTYDGIILDPPAYGIGAKGERWKIEDMLGRMLSDVAKMLKPNGFMVLNVYSLGLSPYIIQNLMEDYFPDREFSIYELCLESRTKQILPLGIVARI